LARSLSPLVLAALALAGAAARAQEPPPRPAAEGPAHHAKPAAGEEPGLEPGELRVRAETQEQLEKGHWAWRGTVDLRLGEMRIQGDKADVFEEPQPDGSVKRRLVAEGNVVFIRGEERLSGDRVEMDDTGRGFFENAVGYVEPGVFIEGRRIERVDDRTYRVEGGKFTSCAQPNPRWGFTASTARIEVDDKLVAKNALLKVKGVPLFYTPYMYYPIRRDGRSTGFLFPHFGYSSTRGFEVGTAFFWAMARSVDQTFYADSYSRIGYGFGHEIRYAEESPSRGTFRTYIFRVQEQNLVTDPGTGEYVSGRPASTEWDIDWNAMQMLPGSVRGMVNVRKYSDILFNQRYQDSFNMASNRTERWSGSLEKDLKLAVLSAYADTTSTYFGTDYQRVNGRLPGVSLRRFPRQVGFGGIVFGLEGTAESIRYGDQTKVDKWSRYDVAPTLSRPIAVSFLEINPSAGYRYTHYGSSYGVDENGTNAVVGPPLDRSFFETQVEMRGPTFSRVFDTPGFGYSERFKHTIGPEVSWTYRSRVDAYNSIPKFDGDDYYLGTNQIAYSLVQRFYAKRKGPTGKQLPYEFFSWRLMQTYYVQIAEGQNNFDPNYSSSAFGPGFKPEHLSPLMSRMRFRPTPAWAFDFNVEYDVNFNQFRRESAAANVRLPRFQLQGAWTRSVRLSEDPAQRTVGSHTIRGNGVFEILPRRLTLEGSADYDLVNDMLWQMRGELRYSVQCCGFSIENIRYNWNGRDEVQWRFKLELANIGAMGNFQGVDAASSRQGLAGYR
jgi:lipopolysaccharide assembly outer membrane protein LptD (OstA)